MRFLVSSFAQKWEGMNGDAKRVSLARSHPVQLGHRLLDRLLEAGVHLSAPGTSNQYFSVAV